MRLILCVLSTLVGSTPWLVAAEPAVRITLAETGKPAATIVLGKSPTRAAQFAAFELQWHLQQITGGQFRIVRENDAYSGTVILVGDSSAVRRLGIQPEQFAKQEYVVRFTPQALSLVLVGRDKPDHGTVQYDQTPSQQAFDTWPGIWDEQGTMYAVYDFLQRECGVRWFNPTEFGTDCPKQPTLVVAGTERRRSPFMKYRYAYYVAPEAYDQYAGLWPGGSEGYKRWEALAYPRLRQLFDAAGYTPAKRGWVTLFRLRHREGGEFCPGNHSLYGYYRRFWAEEKGQESLFVGRRADWFAQGYEGQPPQMCYSSRGLVEQVAADACEFFATGKTYPGAQAGGETFCVEPMDNDMFCKCARCRAWLVGRDEDSPFFTNGRHSDYFFQFVNEVAKIVGRRWPHKKIVCLAYMTHGAPPERFRLEPNVLVQYCFACNRLNFDRPSYEHEVRLLERWRREYPGRPLYLWLYDTFPVEIAAGGSFHCFPGFFARAVGEQFDLFTKFDYRGVFHCGYGQDVEAYLTYRLMDDPSLRVGPMLDEYFTRLYGPAAGLMRKFYETVERTYGNPANYPAPIALGAIEGHHHQTEEVAWGYLGTEARMQTLGRLMAEAKAAAQTPEQKQRVALFELGVWDYMTAGRAKYLARVKAEQATRGTSLRVPFSSRGPLGGDPARIDPADALTLSRWRSRLAEPTRRGVAARLVHDGKWLYLQMEQRGAAALAPGREYWQLVVVKKRGGPARSVYVSDAGKCLWDGKPLELATATRRDAASTVVGIAVPLAKLGVDGGGKLLFNVARRSPGSEDEPMWSPSFGAFDDPAAMGELTLDPPDTIPVNVPAAAELERLALDGLVARWPLDEGQGTTVRSTDGKLPGTLVGRPKWIVDGPRRSVRFEDSRRQHVDFGADKAFNLTGPMTLSVWVRYEPTDTWYPALLGKGYELSGAYGLHLRPGNTVWFEIDAPDGTRHIHNPPDRCLAPGQWCHVAATYDGATMRVYVNGREAGPAKTVKTTVRINAEPLRFGWLGSYGHFNGAARDARLYRRALSHGEIFATYKAGP